MTYRPVDADNWIADQPKAVREAAEARAKVLIEEYSLRQVRDAVKRTQTDVARAMGVTQDRVSKLERSPDALVSTLKKHVRALGGDLKLMVEFPDRPPMTIDLRGGHPVARSVKRAAAGER